MAADIATELQHQVSAAMHLRATLQIIGGNSKAFYGRSVTADQQLYVAAHSGITHYEPTELVITARAGTPLAEIERLLSENGQMLPFEPPAFASSATIGGTIATNFSGPARAYAGAARDFLLGCTIINGKSEIVQFGGEVMKNVAGYDVSRLMAGALGTLGVLLSVSLKVLPKAEATTTCLLQCSATEGLERLQQWGQLALPISASSWHDNMLYVRLSGGDKAVNAAAQTIGGELHSNSNNYWQQLKEQQLPFFQQSQPLWRLSVAADRDIALHEDVLLEWGGALRWLHSSVNTSTMQQQTAAADGHAILFRNGGEGVFQPLSAPMLRLHQKLKQAFDPYHIFNPGKLYPDL